MLGNTLTNVKLTLLLSVTINFMIFILYSLYMYIYSIN